MQHLRSASSRSAGSWRHGSRRGNGAESGAPLEAGECKPPGGGVVTVGGARSPGKNARTMQLAVGGVTAISEAGSSEKIAVPEAIRLGGGRA
jgi:hypothetical protein